MPRHPRRGLPYTLHSNSDVIYLYCWLGFTYKEYKNYEQITAEQIKDKYHAKLRQYHPDKLGRNPDEAAKNSAEHYLRVIRWAYGILGDPEERVKRHDMASGSALFYRKPLENRLQDLFEEERYHFFLDSLEAYIGSEDIKTDPLWQKFIDNHWIAYNLSQFYRDESFEQTYDFSALKELHDKSPELFSLLFTVLDVFNPVEWKRFIPESARSASLEPDRSSPVTFTQVALIDDFAAKRSDFKDKIPALEGWTDAHDFYLYLWLQHTFDDMRNHPESAYKHHFINGEAVFDIFKQNHFHDLRWRVIKEIIDRQIATWNDPKTVSKEIIDRQNKLWYNPPLLKTVSKEVSPYEASFMMSGGRDTKDFLQVLSNAAMVCCDSEPGGQYVMMLERRLLTPLASQQKVLEAQGTELSKQKAQQIGEARAELKKELFNLISNGDAPPYISLERIIQKYADEPKINERKNLVADFFRGFLGVILGLTVIGLPYVIAERHRFFSSKTRQALADVADELEQIRSDTKLPRDLAACQPVQTKVVVR